MLCSACEIAYATCWFTCKSYSDVVHSATLLHAIDHRNSAAALASLAACREAAMLRAMLANTPLLCSRLFGVSNSATRPSSNTMIRSESIMVLRRCAIVMTVRSRNRSRITR